MSQPVPKRNPWLTSCAGIAVLISACLPWGLVDFGRIKLPFEGPVGEGFQDVLSSFGPITVTAWNGHARLGPLTLPNVLVVLAGIAAIVITWLAARGIWKSPRWLPFALAGYGLAHTGYVLISMMVAEEARPQIGAFLSTAAFAGMLASLLVENPKAQARSPAS